MAPLYQIILKNEPNEPCVSIAIRPVHVIGHWLLGEAEWPRTAELPSRRFTFWRPNQHTIDRLQHAWSHYPTIWTSGQLRWHPFLEHTGHCSCHRFYLCHPVDIWISRKNTLTIPLIPTTTFPRINSTTTCSIGQDYLQRYWYSMSATF